MKVRIRNFQSIQDLELEIEGFTVLVGKNNIGKSAIRRGINGALTNASGIAFVREGTKSAIVELETEGLKLHWEKGKSANNYTVNGKDYARVGHGAPEEIAAAGFKQLVLSNKEKLNPQFADTHSPIFLLDKPGPTIAELISSVSRLSVINQANRLCDKDGRDIRATLKIREADLQLVDQRLERFADFPNLQELNDLVQQAWAEILNVTQEIGSITQYEAKLITYGQSIDLLSGVSDIEIPEDVLSPELRELQDITGQLAKLDELESSISRLSPITEIEIPQSSFDESSEIMQMDKWLANIETLGTQIKRVNGVADLKIPSIEDMILDELSTIAKLLQLHESIGSEIAKLEETEASKSDEISQLEKDLHDVLEDLDSCPVCDKFVVQ